MMLYRIMSEHGIRKILTVYHSMAEHGGAAKMYALMANHWVMQKGYTVAMFSIHGQEESVYKLSPSIKIKSALKIFKKIPGKVLRSLTFPLALQSLIETIRNETPDLMIVNTGPYYTMILGLVAAKITKTPFILWEHAGYYMESTFLYKITRRLVFPRARSVVLLTEGDRQHALKLNKNSVTVLNTFEPEPISSAVKGKTVLFVGRLCRQKAVDHVLKAWQKAHQIIPDWKLKIVGDGELRVSLEALAKKLDIGSSVHFMGASSDVGKYYDEASIFALTSRQEGLPLVLIEAMNHNVALVSYDCPYGPRTIIEHDVNGLLVEPDNIYAMSEAIVTLANSEEKRKFFAENGQEKLKKFSIEVVSAEWEKLFESLRL